MWQENLFNNLLVLGIFVSLAVIIYCKIKNKDLIDVYKEAKEIVSPTEYE